MLAAGCAAHAPMPAPAGPRAMVAMLPLENLSGRSEVADRLTQIVWVALGNSPVLEPVEPGEVDAAMADARLRSSLAVTGEQVGKIAQRTGARWIVAGTILECGTVHTPDGDVPSLSLSLRLLDGKNGRVRWTQMRARSGEDRESVFGWGRVTNLDRLAQDMAQELVSAIRLPVAADSTSPGGKP
jgi:hypothetical protein